MIVTSPFVPLGPWGLSWGRYGKAEWVGPGKELGVSGYQRTIGEVLSLAPVVSLLCLGGTIGEIASPTLQRMEPA